jgi:hypothetical protein
MVIFKKNQSGSNGGSNDESKEYLNLKMPVK